MSTKILNSFVKLVFSYLICMSLCSCTAKFNLFSDYSKPLDEYVIQGDGDEKILMISLSGVISDEPSIGLLKDKPSMVQEIVSQLRMAEQDDDVKVILLKINSPGGFTTASDILYHELMEYKKRSGVKIVTCMMDIAASGGYYAALASDHIVAHPTTVTGSIGVIFMRPKIAGLMDKIGVEMEIDKSGKNKDMGSPFRKLTQEEKDIFQNLISDLGTKFVELVKTRRALTDKATKEVATARVYLAGEALKIGLIDQIGYLDDAISQCKSLAKMPDDASVVVYRRSEYPDDNLYNSSAANYQGAKVSLINLGVLESLTATRPGFYYIWPAALPSSGN